MPRSEFPKEILLLGRQNSSTGVYDLPQFNFKNSLDRILENRVFRLLILAIIILLVWSLYTGTIYVGYFKNELNPIFNNLENNFNISTLQKRRESEMMVAGANNQFSKFTGNDSFIIKNKLFPEKKIETVNESNNI